jgi:filamentous hemagglutinin
MAVTRIKNNQITDATVVANAKLVDYSISSAKLANNLTYNSDLTITGNLTVQGNATAIDSTITTIEDPVIVLASTQTSGAPGVDIGFLGFRGNESNIAFVWDESSDEFVTAFTSTGETNTTVTVTSYANFHTNDANIGGNIVINGTTSLVGNIVGAVSFTGNITAGNLLTPGQVSATGNLIGGNIATGGTVSATGNVTGGNILFGSGIITGTGNIYGGNIIAEDAFFGNIDLTGDITVNSLTSNTFVSATGNVISGNVLTGGIVSATSTVIGGNLATGGTVSATGNVTGGNLLTGGVISATGAITSATTITGGNLATGGTVSATGNITGGNILTGGLISATGLATSGNVQTAGFVSAGGNVYGGNIVSNTVTNTSGDLTISAANNLVLEPTGNVVLEGGKWINSVNDPVQAQDAATKQYVDDAVSTGITIHTPVRVESPTDIGGTYAQGGTTATVTDTVAGNTVVFSSAISPQVNDQYWFSNSFNGITANTPYFVVSAPNTSAAVLSLTYSGAPVSNITGGTGLTQGVRINSGQGATLTNSGANATLVIDGVTLSNTNRVLIYTQANAVHNGVYVVSEAGNATTAWQLTRSSDMDTYIPDDVNGLDAGDYFYVQEGDTGAGESYVMTAPIGPTIIGFANLTFTQFSASQVYTANTNAGLSLTGTVFSAKVDNNTTAFDGGGNIIVKAGANLTTPNIGDATGTSLSLTGNITSGNVVTGGFVTVTGNVTGGNLLYGSGIVSGTGNIYATNFIGNISGNIDAGGANTNIQFNDGDILAGSPGFTFDKVGNVVTANGNIIGANFSTAGLVTATGNVTGGNVLTGGLISATGTITSAANITGGNLLTGGLISATSTITSAANVIGGNITTAGLVTATGNVTGGNVLTAGLVSATGNITGADLILTTGTIDGPAAGRITINGSDIDTDFAVDGDTVANVFYVDAGTGTASFGASTQVTNAIVNFATTTSIKAPVGNTAQRPATGVTGMVRFNTTSNALEVYDNTEWTSVGVPVFTVIADEQFNGDGTTVAFTLATSQTTNSCIVSINGVVQIPTSAYSVSTTTLTFTEAPLSGDLIDVRQITTTTSVTSIANSSGNAVIATSPTSAQVNVTGDLSVSGSILGGNINSTAITNGTSNVSVVSSGGNVTTSVGGTSNVVVVSSTDVTITGNLTVTGNATLSGNILGDRIQNGTTIIDIQSTGGNANITIGGTANTAVFSNTALTLATPLLPSANITYDLGSTTQRWKDLWLSNSTIYLGNSQISANASSLIFTNPAGGTTVLAGTGGNITGGNITTGGLISATGGITGAALTGTSLTVSTGNVSCGNIVNTNANGVGNIGSTGTRFNQVFALASSAQYADLAEKYTADAEYAPGTVLVFGGTAEVTVDAQDADRRVAGVVSTNPAYIMNDTLESTHIATVALTGRVPCLVTGPVRKGDLMVVAGLGRARAEADPRVGTVIGKALEDFEGESGTIEVVVGRF